MILKNVYVKNQLNHQGSDTSLSRNFGTNKECFFTLAFTYLSSKIPSLSCSKQKSPMVYLHATLCLWKMFNILCPFTLVKYFFQDLKVFEKEFGFSVGILIETNFYKNLKEVKNFYINIGKMLSVLDHRMGEQGWTLCWDYKGVSF